MRGVSTVKRLLSEAGPSNEDGDAGNAFWCDDCGERLLAEREQDDPPSCPECGSAMRFERTPDSGGCAC